MNTTYRKPLPNHNVDYYDTRAAVNAIQAGAYETLPYTSRVLAEQLVRKSCDYISPDENPNYLTECLTQLIERKQPVRRNKCFSHALRRMC